jgi:hypothetical protein
VPSLDRLLGNERLNAALAWAAVVGLVVGAVVSVVGGDPLWAAFALVAAAVAVGPAVTRRSWTTMLRWEMLAVVLVAVLVRAFGAYVSPAGYVATAGLALVVAVQLDAFTAVEMTPRFGVLFVTVATAAFAGVWSVVEFTADAVLGTAFLVGVNELMWDLVLATAVGLVAGLCFDLYLRASDHERTGPTVAPDRGDPGSRGRRTALGGSTLRYAVRGMQAFLVLATVYAVATVQYTLIVNTGVPLALAAFPTLVRWRYDRDLSAGLALWIATAAALHALGALGLYAWFGWYDQVTHTVSASLVAGVGYAIVGALERYSTAVEFPPRFRVLLVLLFVLGIGVIWEILEFATGGIAALVGGEPVLAQYGLRDIALDLVFDAVGGLLVALWGTRYFDDVANGLARRLHLHGE